MSSVFKSLFDFSQTKQKDVEISNKITKIEGLIRDIEKDKHHDLAFKMKNLLNAALFEQKGQSLFQMVYRSATKESPVEWVPVFGKALGLLSSNSTFMRLVIETQDYKIPIEKYFIPNYLFKNNLLNENSGYQSISNSISGLMVPVIDYVFIRLLHAIYNVGFSEVSKDSNSEYQSDDIYFYISRNPYLMLLKNYFDAFASNDKHLRKLVGNIKMFFVDEILLRHRINKSSSYLKDYGFFLDRCKIKPQYLLVIYLLLKKGRAYFDQKYLFFYEIIERFQSLIESEHQIFFRFFFRVFLFAYSRNSIENKVIDHLDLANQKDGVFELERFSTSQFERTISSGDRKQRNDFNQSKTLLLKLLEKDQNLTHGGKIHFSTLRTLGCYLHLQNMMNSLGQFSSTKQSQDPLRVGNEASSLQITIQRIYRQSRSFLLRQMTKTENKFTKENQQKLKKQISELAKLYQKAYGRRIDFSKYEDHKESHSMREIGARGNNEDFSFSIETYKSDIALNCWKVPLKSSEYEILYNLFYWLAKKIDAIIPGAKKEEQPRINLRYFSNPFVFMFTIVLLTIILKITF